MKISFQSANERLILVSLLLTSLVCVAQQILLTRIFSVVLRFHFAFVAVSVAMLGAVLGGLLVLYFNRRFSQLGTIRFAAVSSAISSWLLVFSLWLTLNYSHSIDSSWLVLVKLGAVYLGVLLPFVAAGAAVAALISGHPQIVHRLYGADMLGAAGAGLLITVILKMFDAPTAAIMLAWLSSLAAFLLAVAENNPQLRRRLLFSSYYIGILLVIQLITAGFSSPLFRVGSVKGRTEASLFFDRWNSYSRVTVEPFTTRPFLWGASNSFRKEIAASAIEQRWMTIDGDAGTVLTKFDGDLSKLDYLKGDVVNAVYHLRKDAQVYIAGAGGGRDILSALVFGQKNVVAAELNSAVLEVLGGRLSDFTGGLDRLAEVSLVNQEARNYLKRTVQNYDIIQLSLVDTWAALAGSAYTLSESSAYTVEAFSEYLERLTPWGILSISRWSFEKHRLLSVAVESLRQRGIEGISDHLILLEVPGNSAFTLLVSRSPLAGVRPGSSAVSIDSRRQFRKDRGSLRKLREEYGIWTTLWPGRPARNEITAKLVEDNWDREFFTERGLGALLEPATDDRPFFFFDQQESLSKLINPVYLTNYLFGRVGGHQAIRILVCLSILSFIAFLGVLFIPPFLAADLRKEILCSPCRVLYFAAIGLGFILIEISQLQRLNVSLGHPFYGTTLVLSVLLSTAGIGGYFSNYSTTLISERKLIITSLVLLLIYGFGSNWLLPLISEAGFYPSIIGSLLMLALIGFSLGVWFPLAFRHAAELEIRGSLPWLWAVNAAAAVLGSSLAVILALIYGISAAFWLGVACYFLAALLLKLDFNSRLA